MIRAHREKEKNYGDQSIRPFNLLPQKSEL